MIYFNDEVRCFLRDEVYKVAKACLVNEAWYIEELCTQDHNFMCCLCDYYRLFSS